MDRESFRMNSFLLGFFIFPCVWLVIRTIVRFVYFQRRSFVRWYQDLPPKIWLGQFLILLGLKFTTPETVPTLLYNGVWWITVKNSKRFEDSRPK